MFSRYTKKRKRDLDEDTSRRSDQESSPRKSSRRRRRSSSGSPARKSGANEESMSIEETNKLRASLGLPPLEVDGPKDKSSDDEESSKNGDKVIVKDGQEFVHKAAESLTQRKEHEKVKERLELQSQKRKIQNKLLKSKGLADSESEDEDAAAWVEKNRRIEEQRRKAEEKARELDQFDDEVEQSVISVKKVRRVKSKVDDALGGMTVGHSKEVFADGHETILVLEDRGVLDEDGEEVLVNPTLQYNEQIKKNLEMKKKKKDYNPYSDEEVDEFGVIKKKEILAKYDEGLDGPKTRETFKLNEKGEVNLAQEEEELRIKRNLYMANRKLQSLEMPKYKVAAEFYTEEEMISFRKPKKKKDGSKTRKRKNKTDIVLELEPEQETEAEKKAKEERLKARRGENGHNEVKEEKMEIEDGEIVETPKPKISKQRFRDTMGATVDTSRMKSLLEKYKKEEESDEEEDDDLHNPEDLQGMVIDDDVEDELQSALEKARKMKLMEQAKKDQTDSSKRIAEMIKKERRDTDDEMDVDNNGDRRIVFDSTAEYYKTVGDFQSIGLAGNRDVVDDYSEVAAAIAKEEAEKEAKKIKEEIDDEDISEEISKIKKKHKEKKKKKESSSSKHKKKHRRSHSRSRFRSRSRSRSPIDVKKEIDEKPKTDREYENVLGKEKDVTKGVAGMLKLASEKGYLEDPNAKKAKGGTLKHLESKCFAKVEFGKYDIEDKYLKKMERLGTTGRGPLRPFSDKKDYVPQIELNYVDQQGKDIDAKSAFRVLSHKFHGKQPGKKQIEKRMRQQEKKERLKKMNSSDTPLGTLEKQRKKTEQLQTPHIVLSGSNRDNGLTLQKD